MSNTISRRDLLKGAVAGAAGIATMGVLSACGDKTEQVVASAPGVSTSPSTSPAPVSAPAVYKAGTYTSIQNSAYASVEVTCTFSESALTDVKYNVLRTSHSDYFTPFASPMEQYCQRIVENGKADGVDGVAGASLCSGAIRDGVNACTAQALGLPTAPAPLNPQEEGYDTFDGDCAEVFSSIKVGNMTLPTRVVKSAGSAPWFVNGDRMPATAEVYGMMAENGVGLNIIQAVVVMGLGLAPYGLETAPSIEEVSAKVKPVVDRIHAAGGKLGIQLSYSGSPLGDPNVPNNLTIEQIDQFIDNVGIAAARIKTAGFDCIEIKAASADELNSFLTRRDNQREDEYGPQSIENRTRLFRRMIEKIKEINGADYPVGALINGVEESDMLLGKNDLCITIEESKAIAKALEDAGAAWIQIRVGVSRNGQELNMWAPDITHIAAGVDGINGYGAQFDFSAHYGGMLDGSHSGFASFLPIVKAIKEAVKVPVGCAGYTDLRVGPDYLNDAIKRGDIDLIFMNRPLNADPKLLTKMKEGKREDVLPCMHCLHCIDNISRGIPATCRVNACSYNALTDSMPEGFTPAPAAVKKNVMVIGAGPAGMEAARVAAERGHKVTIYDSADKLGGLLHFARGVKGDHERFEDYIAYHIHQLEKNGVEVKLMTKVDAALVKEQKPDAVILAVGGSRESKLSGDNVFSPEDAFGSSKLGERVVVLGVNAQALDFAVHLTTIGKKVTMVHGETANVVGKGQSGYFADYLSAHLRGKGTKIWNGATVKGLSSDGLTITTDVGLTKVIPCDSVVEFYDMVPNTALAKEIEAAGIEVHAVGDCAEPWNIQKAVRSGNLTARAL